MHLTLELIELGIHRLNTGNAFGGCVETPYMAYR